MSEALKIKNLNLTESKMISFAWFCQQQKQISVEELETYFINLLNEYETNPPYDFINAVNLKKRKINVDNQPDKGGSASASSSTTTVKKRTKKATVDTIIPKLDDMHL